MARAALKAAMESAQRRRKRPPARWRWPLNWPLSRSKGATPKSAAASPPGERAQLRAEGPGGGRGQRAHAPDGDEPRRLGGEVLLCGEGLGAGRLELGDLRAEHLEPGPGQGLDQRELVPRGLDLDGAALEHGLLARPHQLLQRGLRRARGEIGLGQGHATEIRERLRIHGIGLGPAAQAPGKAAHLLRVGHGEGHPGHPGRMGRGDQRAVIVARGLPVPSGTALRAKAPPFGYLAPLGSHTTWVPGASSAKKRRWAAGLLGRLPRTAAARFCQRLPHSPIGVSRTRLFTTARSQSLPSLRSE